MVMPNSVLVVSELARSAINCEINAGIEVVVLVVANEILVALNIRPNLDVVSVWGTFDRHRKLLQSIEEFRQLADLRHDILGDRFGQFHVFCADSDEHVEILHGWRTIGLA